MIRAKLIELTAERSTSLANAVSRNSELRIAWQSSKSPAMATERTLAAVVMVMKRRWTSEIRPSGNSTTMRTPSRPAKASTAAPPVSPEVAQTMVSVRPRAARTWA